MAIDLDFNFEYMQTLYKSDKDKFEELRADMIEKTISQSSADSQRRLRGLQFKIDAQREIHKNSPLGACVQISKMMHESFDNMRRELNKFTGKNTQVESGFNATSGAEFQGKANDNVYKFK